MFEEPAETEGPAFRIPSSTNRVKGEANAKKPPDQPMGNRVAGKIEQHPRHQHRDDSDSCRLRGPGHCKSKAGDREASKLRRISGRDGNPAEDFTARRQGWPFHMRTHRLEPRLYRRRIGVS